jgi:hypothetical protein
MRVTDAATMQAVEWVLSGEVQQQIVGLINQAGGKAVGLSGRDGGLLQAKKLAMPDAAHPGAFIDLGQVGDIVSVDTAIVRIFNTYGPRMRANDGRALPTFLRQALLGQPITVFGDGSQTRSFCYVEDLVAGLIALNESGEHNPVNIGNPNEFTLLEAAEKVVDITGSQSKIVFEPLPTDDPQVRKPDITRAKSILGWEPKVELIEGLQRTIDESGEGQLTGVL